MDVAIQSISTALIQAAACAHLLCWLPWGLFLLVVSFQWEIYKVKPLVSISSQICVPGESRFPCVPLSSACRPTCQSKSCTFCLVFELTATERSRTTAYSAKEDSRLIISQNLCQSFQAPWGSNCVSRLGLPS